MSNPKKHVSLDIETTGLIPESGIWQVGVQPLYNWERAFVSTINPQDCADAGMLFDPETISWQRKANSYNWNAANELDQFVEGQAILLNQLADYLYSLGDRHDLIVWCKGTHFDITILEAAYRKLAIPVPWKYNQVFDMRALEFLFPHCKLPSPSGAHDALVDAQHQARVIELVLNHVQKTV